MLPIIFLIASSVQAIRVQTNVFHEDLAQLSDDDFVGQCFDATKTDLSNLLDEAWDGRKMGAEFQIPFIPKNDWVQHGLDGSIGFDRAEALANHVKECQPKKLLEIGSFLGFSANFFLRVMEPWNGTLTSVDPNVRHRVFEHPRDFFHRMTDKFGKRVHAVDGFWGEPISEETGFFDYLHREPVSNDQYIKAIMSNIPTISPDQLIRDGAKFDMAFIDGAHDSYSRVNDFLRMKNIMNRGSCVVFDNMDEESVRNGLHEIQKIVGDKGTFQIGEKVALFKDDGFLES